MYSATANSPSIPGAPAVDEGHNSQLGFRSDWDLTPRDKVTVQGDFSGASEGQTITTMFFNQLPTTYVLNDQVRVDAQNVLGRWNHVFSNGSETTVQAYYDRSRRFDQALNVESTGDLDFQYHFHAGARNDIVTGIDYRLNNQSYINGYEVSFGNGYRRDQLFSGFIQDELRLTDSLSLTLGVKLEHNAYTGFEYEPGVQLAWSPSKGQTFWASASRAIQQPSWLYAEAQVDAAAVPLGGCAFGIVQLSGNPRGLAPVLWDYELGYRTQLAKRLTLDLTFFLSDYDRLQTIDTEAPFFTEGPPAHLVLPSVYGNLGNATNYGTEISAHWDVAKWWRISPGVSFLQMDLSLAPGGNSTNDTYAMTAGDSPKWQTQLRSNIRLPHNVEWDTAAYYVGALHTAPSATSNPVPAYTRLDTRLAWHFGENTEIGITGQNLLTPRHPEFLDGLQVTSTEAARAIVAKVTWHF